MQCPKCSSTQDDGLAECKKCGIIFERYFANQPAHFTIEQVGPGSNVIRYGIGAAVLAGVLFAVIGIPGKSAPPSEQPAAAKQPSVTAKKNDTAEPQGSRLDQTARKEYDAAKRAIMSGDLETADEHFSAAIDAQDDFLEAFFNRGAARGRMAIDLMRSGRQDDSLRMYRDAVDDKTRAKELMDEGKWYVYLTQSDQQTVRSNVRNALQDADEVLADETALIAALKLWAGVRD